jgi:ATP-binding cassette subfamily F protein 3
MARVTVQGLSKSYGGRDLFVGVSLEVHAGTRLAVVGPNGCGKSTFLKILAGQVEPDGGSVHMPRGIRVGFVEQELTLRHLEMPLEDFVLEVVPSWAELWQSWRQAVEAQDSAAMERLAQRQAELELLCGYNPEHQARAILSGLGFPESAGRRPLMTFSGGWRERAKLARVLVAGADILLLDEPTNHLDLDAVQWLEDYLQDFSGVVVFVAHDRYFLDRVATRILFLGAGKPILRDGNFSQFIQWFGERAEQARREATKLQEEIARKQSFVDRFRYKATKARQAQSRLGQIARLKEQLQSTQVERRPKTLNFSWPQPDPGSQTVVTAVDLGFSFADAPLFSGLHFQIVRGQKIALVGPNGRGKSTLLKILTGHLQPTQGSVTLGSSITVGYFSQHQTEILWPHFSVLAELKRLASPACTDFQLKSVLGLFLLGEAYWEKKVEELSGGEKNRLILAHLFLKRANFLVLDEPTNHLDMESREALVEALGDYSGTVLVVAHDRYLLSHVAEEIWELTPQGLVVHHTGFDDYLCRKTQPCGPGAERLAVSGAASGTQRSHDPRRVRRERAEARHLVSRQLKPLREQFAQGEARLEALLAEQEEVERILVDPATYADPAQAQELGRRHGELARQAEEVMTQLAYLEREIQEWEQMLAAEIKSLR